MNLPRQSRESKRDKWGPFIWTVLNLSDTKLREPCYTYRAQVVSEFSTLGFPTTISRALARVTATLNLCVSGWTVCQRSSLCIFIRTTHQCVLSLLPSHSWQSQDRIYGRNQCNSGCFGPWTPRWLSAPDPETPPQNQPGTHANTHR